VLSLDDWNADGAKGDITRMGIFRDYCTCITEHGSRASAVNPVPDCWFMGGGLGLDVLRNYDVSAIDPLCQVDMRCAMIPRCAEVVFFDSLSRLSLRAMIGLIWRLQDLNCGIWVVQNMSFNPHDKMKPSDMLEHLKKVGLSYVYKSVNSPEGEFLVMHLMSHQSRDFTLLVHCAPCTTKPNCAYDGMNLNIGMSQLKVGRYLPPGDYICQVPRDDLAILLYDENTLLSTQDGFLKVCGSEWIPYNGFRFCYSVRGHVNWQW